WRERLAVCLVGAEERHFRPGWAPPERFTALFIGKLIPLHGLETILAAARLPPGPRFPVLGSGPPPPRGRRPPHAPAGGAPPARSARPTSPGSAPPARRTSSMLPGWTTSSSRASSTAPPARS